MKVNYKLKSEKTGQILLVSTGPDGRNVRVEIADSNGKKFSDFFAPARGGAKGKKLQTRQDASITGISYQIGKRQTRNARTQKLLPTSIYLEVAGDDEL
jgi:hypothetical protein